MIRTHPLTPAAGTLVACAAMTFAMPALPVAAVAWVMLGVAAGYSISGSPWSFNSADLLTSSVWRGQQKHFVLGLLAGALTGGLVAGAIGGIVSIVPAAPRIWLAAAVLVLLLGFELTGRPLDLPQNRRLVPQDVIRRADVEGPLQFGFEMGTGVRTFMPTALPHALVALVVLLGGLGPGILAGLGFGLGRGLMPIARLRHGDAAGWDRLLAQRLRLVGQLCAAAFALAAATVVIGQSGLLY
jgi:hypothetical protein